METPGVASGGLDPVAALGGRQAGLTRAGTAPRMSGRELRDFAAEQRRMGLDELQTFADALTGHAGTRERLEQQLAQAWADLLQALVPGLDGPAMAEVCARLGLVEMDTGALARRSQARQAELAAELAALDRERAQPEAARVCAALELRRKALDERLGRLGQTLDALEAEPLFFKLIAARYDTSDYQGRFWQRRYYRHRRQAAELVARHGAALKVRRFQQLYKRYVFEKAAYDRLFLARASLLARASEVAALARRRHEIEAELSALPEWELAYARARIRQHLTEPAEPSRLRALREDPVLGPAASSVVALEDRLRSLGALRAECLDEPRAEAERAVARVEAVLAEFRSPARKLDAVHLREEMERTYGLPLSRWRDLRRRYDDLAGQLSS
jgi:hypothetical protein